MVIISYVKIEGYIMCDCYYYRYYLKDKAFY